MCQLIDSRKVFEDLSFRTVWCRKDTENFPPNLLGFHLRPSRGLNSRLFEPTLLAMSGQRANHKKSFFQRRTEISAQTEPSAQASPDIVV